MDFDGAKENIQPLRGGRRADRLETVLGGEKDLLEHERKEFENAIETYNGHDPLDNWYNYICWIEQSYPKSGNESGLHEAVSKCILKFENDMRYRQDRRLIKLFIKYIDTQDNPHELYEQLFNSGFGTMVADLYIAWSYYYDAANDFKKAENIFQRGLNAGAQPFDELAQAHQAFTVSVTQRMLYDDDSSKQKFRVTMDEKRNALTTLRAYNKKFVGSVRLGNAIKSDNPGKVPTNENAEIQHQQRIDILKDDAGPSNNSEAVSTDVISIFNLAKKTENVHEAGPWNKAKSSKNNKLFNEKSIGIQPGFSIMEDEALPPISYSKKLYEQGCNLPLTFVSTNKPQSSWNIPIVIEESTVPNTIPCYDKFLLYPSLDIEISLEESRAYRWFKSNDKMTAPIIHQHSSVFENTYENGSRIFPGFVSKNIKQDIAKYELDYDINCREFQFPIKKMISKDRTTEYSIEELLADKFKRGEIKLVSNDDFEESLIDDNMDMTIIGDRRQSVYVPPRKSFVPRKSILRKSVMQPINEDDAKHEPAVKSNENQHRVRFEEPIFEEEPEVDEKKNALKRKLEIYEKEKINSKDRDSSPESKRLSADEEFFKTPALPKTTTKPVFELDDNETFSTQNFNFFIKSQSVSTPITKKSVPRLVPLTQENSPQSSDSQGSDLRESSPIENTMASNNLQKQLSTIAEVTETSNSTKSSASHLSAETEIDSHIKTPALTPFKAVVRPDECPKNPLNIFRLPEEPTETTTFIKGFNLPKLKDLRQTPMKMPSFKIFDESLSFPLPTEDNVIPLPDESLQVPDLTIKLPNDSIKITQSKKKIEIHEDSIFEVPNLSDTITNVDKSVQLARTLSDEIPETQDISMKQPEHVEIPATQDITLKPQDDLDVASFSDSTLKKLKEFDLTNEKSIKEQISKREVSMKKSESIKAPNPNINDSFEIPELIDITVKDTEHFEIPATQELTDDLKSPQIQNLSINENEHEEFPATQDMSPEHEEILTTQEVSNKQGRLISISGIQNASARSTATNKMPFSVYEDSICDVPQVAHKPSIVQPLNQSTANMSRKENLIVPQFKRTNSDEFLDLCKSSPQLNYKPAQVIGDQPRNIISGLPKNEISDLPRNEISDLLKFSDAKSKLSLEATFNDLQINKPFKSPSPTMNIFEADLNTEKFNLPLKFGINSTVIGDATKVVPVTKKPEFNEFLDLSIEMNEDEFDRLGKNKSQAAEKKQEDVFKMPIVPPPIQKTVDQPQTSKQQEKKNEFEIFQDDEEDDDLSKSIYHNLKKDQTIVEFEDVETWEDEKMCSFIGDGPNRYEYTIIQNFDESLSFKLRDAIVKSKGNPFSKDVRTLILEQCNFEQYLEDHIDSCSLLKNVPQLKTGGTLQCGNDMYKVAKILGKGGFGSVFEVRNMKNNESYAAKQEKPPNLWEYYILIELVSRLSSKNINHMIPAYMHVYKAIVANNASVLISEYSPHGSLIDVCNKIKQGTSKNVDEYIGMIFTTQLLSIIDYLHSCHIIHADIKPDNFVLMSKIAIGMKVPSLQLIDFGSAIDMDSFDKDDEFTYVVKTDNFTCCEMLENRSWTYQTDLFGICGTAHVILFGKYMEVEKKSSNWQIKTRFPRYFQKDIWDIFFNTLLNVPDCKTMPNLQTLKQHFDEEISYRQKYISDKVAEFNNALLS